MAQKIFLKNDSDYSDLKEKIIADIGNGLCVEEEPKSYPCVAISVSYRIGYWNKCTELIFVYPEDFEK